MNLGVSNVSFGLPDRKIVNMAYLALAISRGLTTAITDLTVPEIQTTLLACDLLMGRDEYSMRWIKAFRAREKPKHKLHSRFPPNHLQASRQPRIMEVYWPVFHDHPLDKRSNP